MAQYDITFDYFHGYESEQFAFYRIPKVLFTDNYFKDLSSDAKILYGLMLDRMSLSIKNHWVDDEDKVYIIFTLEQVMEYMNCGKDKGVKILAELDSNKGIGLIERVKRGLGKPAIIYVKSFLIKDKKENKNKAECQETEDLSNVIEEGEVAEVKTSEKPKSGGRKNRSQEVGDTEVKTSEKPKSGVLENRSPEVGKTDPNYTYINNTDFSDTDIYPINQSIIKTEGETDGMDAMDVMKQIRIYTNIVKMNIEYDILIHDCNMGDKEYIDEIVELMVETITIPRDNVLIAGAEYPYQLVKGKLLKIGYTHIQYILECLHRNTTKVRNVKAYLLTCIFNAPSTISSYYRAEVSHDMDIR
ncbi:MAG: DUF6017 domain-containing protein [Lachnospiraceae bacterium]